MDKITNRYGRILIHLALVGVSVFAVLPFLWSVLNSIKFPVEANAVVPRLWGFDPTAFNFAKLWLFVRGTAYQGPVDEFRPVGIAFLVVIFALIAFYQVNKYKARISERTVGTIIAAVIVLMLLLIPRFVDVSKFYGYLINSIIVTVATLVVSISIGCLGGYALARYSGALGMVILIAALGFRALPRIAFGLPFYYMGQILGLYDTHLLMILVLVAVNQPFTIWMLRGFFMDIPTALEEAAMIDGANRLTTFWKVIIPITWPGIITTSLFTLLLAYNEFLLGRLLLQSNWTLPVAIASYTSGEDAAYRTIAAAASVSISIPVIFVIIFFQKYLVRPGRSRDRPPPLPALYGQGIDRYRTATAWGVVVGDARSSSSTTSW